MRIKNKTLRDFASIVFTVYYLFAAEQADEKVRKVRGVLTVEHMRVSWNKPTTPYLSFFTRITRPKLARYPPRKVLIPRPPESSYKEPVTAWLYFDEPLSAIGAHSKVVLDIPGGGFVAMNPRTHDDKLIAWAGKTGLPILSLDYKKAPEHPYPYALNECYDVYHALVASKGRCIGFGTGVIPRIVLSGDSAGGNLATALTLMILQATSPDSRGWNHQALPPPEGLILIYPGLDFNIGNWMTDEQMALIKDRRMRRTNKNILRRKSEDYYKLTPTTPHPSDDEDEISSPPHHPANGKPNGTPPIDVPQSKRDPEKPASGLARQSATLATEKPQTMKTRLAVSSMISYFNDRILSPEMMRAMIILYVGPHNRPDFTTDYLLSPLLAPEALLSRFPKTFFLTGERDPLVDDTVIFAGRLRQAKYNLFVQRKELGLIKDREEFDERDHVEVALIPGISHGFLQFVSIFPEGWKHIFRCGKWMEEIFDTESPDWSRSRPPTPTTNGTHTRHHIRRPTESSGDEASPLMMTSITSSKADKESHNSSRKSSGEKRKTRRDSDTPRRRRSMVSLASEDDLLSRRMKGVAGGLMGMTSLDGNQKP